MNTLFAIALGVAALTIAYQAGKRAMCRQMLREDDEADCQVRRFVEQARHVKPFIGNN